MCEILPRSVSDGERERHFGALRHGVSDRDSQVVEAVREATDHVHADVVVRDAPIRIEVATPRCHSPGRVAFTQLVQDNGPALWRAHRFSMPESAAGTEANENGT
jgi:hypothetical protein